LRFRLLIRSAAAAILLLRRAAQVISHRLLHLLGREAMQEDSNKAADGHRGNSWPLKENLKAGGGEVAVVGEGFDDAQSPHDFERYVIDNARLARFSASVRRPSPPQFFLGRYCKQSFCFVLILYVSNDGPQ
jgi:hypothetical protein